MARVKLTLESNAFENGAVIPTQHTCEGRDIPPDLRWTHSPEGTQSFVLIVDDPDAPRGTFTHWVRYDVPGDKNMITSEGPVQGKDGRNDFEVVGWRGPCPPPRHGNHRYFFRLHALDVPELGLARGASRREVEKAMDGHVIDTAELFGLFARR